LGLGEKYNYYFTRLSGLKAQRREKAEFSWFVGSARSKQTTLYKTIASAFPREKN